jgi:hypothetical protein
VAKAKGNTRLLNDEYDVLEELKMLCLPMKEAKKDEPKGILYAMTGNKN